jgi:hypothetical protein
MPTKIKAAGPATKGLRITSRSEKGFRRCGRAFGPDGTVVPLSELTEEEVDTLKAERQLVVVEVDIESDKGADKGAKA